MSVRTILGCVLLVAVAAILPSCAARRERRAGVAGLAGVARGIGVVAVVAAVRVAVVAVGVVVVVGPTRAVDVLAVVPDLQNARVHAGVGVVAVLAAVRVTVVRVRVGVEIGAARAVGVRSVVPGLRLPPGLTAGSVSSQSPGESPAGRGSGSPPAASTSVSRPVVVSEFRNGRLLASSNPLWPMSLPVPDAVRLAFADPAVTSVWHEEVVDGQTYETLYARPSPQSPRVLGLGLQRPSWLSRLNTVLLFVIYCAAIALLVAVVVLAVRALRGRPYVFTFRDRLLAALMGTAILPVVIRAVYTRNEAAGRLLAASGERLERETAAIVLNLQQGGDDWRAGVLAVQAEAQAEAEAQARQNPYGFPQAPQPGRAPRPYPGYPTAPRRAPGRSRDTLVEAMAKSAARSVGSQLGRSILRGVLGSILKGR